MTNKRDGYLISLFDEIAMAADNTALITLP